MNHQNNGDATICGETAKKTEIDVCSAKSLVSGFVGNVGAVYAGRLV